MRNPLMPAVWIVGAAVALAIAVFVLANRSDIEISLFPYPGVLVVPVFLVVLAAFAAGALFGGLFIWTRGAPARHLSSRRRRQVKALERDLASASHERDRLKSELDRRASREDGPAAAGA